MAAVQFHHDHGQVGDLTIQNGIDTATWSYGVNAVTYPTYGGEVIQILSVYIDDLTLMGKCATYAQMEQIYIYFANYFSVATQGKNLTPQPGVGSYVLTPMVFAYPERNWTNMLLIPKSAPGFRYGREVVIPQWKITCHVVDDSPDLGLIKDGLKAAAIGSINAASGFQGLTATQDFSLTGQISPHSGNPDVDPFQTYDQPMEQLAQSMQQWTDYYNSLIPAYMQGDFSAITGAIGSQPNFGNNANNQQSSTVNVPATPSSSSTSASSNTSNASGLAGVQGALSGFGLSAPTTKTAPVANSPSVSRHRHS